MTYTLSTGLLGKLAGKTECLDRFWTGVGTVWGTFVTGWGPMLVWEDRWNGC